MGYTLGEAAKATGKDKSTISRAIKKGTISAGKDAHERYDIDPAELHRVYPPKSEATGEQPLRNGSNALVVYGEATPDFFEFHRMQHELELAQKRIKELEADRDRWHKQADRLVLRIADRRPWWKRLFNNTSQPPPERETA